MIPRYCTRQMERLWSEEAKYQSWLDVEQAIIWAKEQLALIPADTHDAMASRATFSVERIAELDKELDHEHEAFIRCVRESLGELAGYFHQDVTSYDVHDPAFSTRLQYALNLVSGSLEGLADHLKHLAGQHVGTYCLALTHGADAEMTIFGWEACQWLAAVERARDRLDRASEVISVGKISGAVGAYTDLDPRIEALACERLGLRPDRASSQIIMRDVHADVMAALAITGGAMEHIAMAIRARARSRTEELFEPMMETEHRSSRMPHKRSGYRCERQSGIARMLRGYCAVALEQVATWDARDMSQSSAEREIFPSAFHALHFSVLDMARTIGGLLVDAPRMEENRESARGLIYSGNVKKLLLAGGHDPDEVYRAIQGAAFTARSQRLPFRDCIANAVIGDRRVSELVSPEGLERCFDYQHHLRFIPGLLRDRFGIEPADTTPAS